MTNQKTPQSAFTIVELLVVIVVIGILAAITIVSYTGITSKAVAAALQSDLTNASQKLKIFQLRDDNPSGNFPATIDCGIPDSATNLCLSTSGGASYTAYSVDNASNPKTFSLTESKDAAIYRITNDSSPVAITTAAPTINAPTATNTAIGKATLSANVTSNGGAAITDRGICWGTSNNPTNCTTVGAGSLGTISTVATGVTPSSIVTSPDNNWVYAVSAYSTSPSTPWNSELSIYSRDPVTGILTTNNTIQTGSSGPSKLAMSTNGVSLYIANEMDTIYTFDRNTTTGAVTNIATDWGMMARYNSIALANDGKSMYVTDGMMSSIVKYSRDTTTGAIANIGTSSGAGSNPDEVIVSPDNAHVYATDIDSRIAMFSRNTTTSELTGLGVVGSACPVMANEAWTHDMTISADGTSVYTTCNFGNTITMYSRNTGTGILTSLGTVTTGTGPGGIEISTDGKTVYTADNGGNTISIFNRDTTTGLLTSAGSIAMSSPGSISIPTDDSSVYITSTGGNNVTMFRRNSTIESTGAFSQDVTGLPSGTIYYRGFATNSLGTSYSATASFTSL